MTIINVLTPAGVRNALEHAAIAQKAGQLVAFVDTKRMLHLSDAVDLGVNINDLLISEPGPHSPVQGIIDSFDRVVDLLIVS